MKTDTKTLEEVVSGLRDALPLAEKGEFAAVMLSGRNAFGDKMPQFTDMFSAYDRFYTGTVLATITTTMQVYPTGYEWLTKPATRGSSPRKRGNEPDAGTGSDGPAE